MLCIYATEFCEELRVTLSSFPLAVHVGVLCSGAAEAAGGGARAAVAGGLPCRPP